MRRDVDLGDRKVTLIGTAHVSEESRREVEQTIDEVDPDLVGVELDEKRFSSLRDKEGWKHLDLADAIRDGKGYLLMMNLLLAIYQRSLGLDQDVEPGSELLAAVEAAERNDTEFTLLDRDISDTFERLRDEMSLREKLFLLTSFFLEAEDQDVEELKDVNVLDSVIRDLEEDFPSVKKVLLDERNAYMVEKLLEKDFDHAVVVVGAAHMDGMVELFKNDNVEVPPPTKSIPWLKVLKYGFPLGIIGLIAYSFYNLGFSAGISGLQFWVVINSLAAMTGAIIARSHIVTWVTSLVLSPLTSLYPLIGVGMIAAYVEGKFYPPTVEEMEDLPYTEKYRDLWGNQAGRILLTFVLVSLFGSLATFAGAGYIASLFFFF